VESSQSYGEDKLAFLHSCKMKMEIRLAQAEDLPRVSDLYARANQTAAFSVSFHINDLETYVDHEDVRVGIVSDIYGDYGLVAAVTVFPKPTQVHGFAVSCRLAGRGVGSALLGAEFNRHSYPIYAEWKTTKYNHGVKSLYEWYGFSFIEKNNLISALLKKPTYVALPSWIELL
jgi:FkbH-like protein